MDDNKRQKVDERLRKEQIIWLATTRPNGTPHLVPIWYAWDGSKVYFATPPNTQKIRNIRQTPRVAIALPDGMNVVVLEGDAALVDGAEHKHAAELFNKKYEWDFGEDADYVVVGVTPTKFLAWGQE
ncbi:MAG: pyridoxamine 5'-phosphate oxidase family protein [Anaerolineae bacterium]|nr:pyridoxamine 5'-phosphate oxidase family protein [Anaerolineae bacterium]